LSFFISRADDALKAMAKYNRNSFNDVPRRCRYGILGHHRL